MSDIKLRRPINVGMSCTHKRENMRCEVTAISVDCDGQALIETTPMDGGDVCKDSVANFLRDYRLSESAATATKRQGGDCE